MHQKESPCGSLFDYRNNNFKQALAHTVSKIYI